MFSDFVHALCTHTPCHCKSLAASWVAMVSRSGSKVESSGRRCTWPAPPNNSIDLLHLRGFVSSSFHLLEGWQVVIIAQALVVVINAEAELDHPVDALLL